MAQSIPFLRARAISFICIIFLSFLWIILLCLSLFAQWTIMDHIERSLLLMMLFIDAITVIMLPILLVLNFRPWLDAARFLFLMLTHTGMAIFFSAKKASFQRNLSEPDHHAAIYNLINSYVSVTSWFIPVLVAGYSCGLAYHVYLRQGAQPEATLLVDVENQDTKRLTSPN